MTYKGIIFDLDGVICSTDDYHYMAWKKLADKLCIEFNEDINHRLRGISRMDSLEIILENSKKTYSKEEKNSFAEEKNNYYVDLLSEMNESDLAQEVLSSLNEIRAKGIIIAIGSSSRNAKIILKKIGLENYFDNVVDGNMISNSKPDPEVFLKAADAMGFEPSQCLVVEDAIAGVEAAIQGGFNCAGIGEASKDKRVILSLNSFNDILSIV